MSTFKAVVAGLAMSILAGGNAIAGDIYLPSSGSIKDYGDAALSIPGPTPIDETVGWYLRADAGYVWWNEPSMTENNAHRLQVQADDTWSYGGGIGYYFTRNFRGDITLDYTQEASLVGVNRSALRIATLDGADPDTLPDFNINYAPAARLLRLKTVTGLANFYWDIDGFGYFTPYVGFGLGAVHHTFGGNGIQTNVVNSVTSASSPGVGSIASSSDTAFAAALHAGVSYEVAKGYRVDAGYTMLYTQGGESGEIVVNNAVDNTFHSVGKIKIDDMIQHRLRVGLRYDLW